MEDEKQKELTTLQVARLIADAVVIAYEGYSAGFDLGDERPDHEHPPTQAVLRVLHETNSWFCRLSEAESGETVEQPYEEIQPPLF
jgi:hypothetical protein